MMCNEQNFHQIEILFLLTYYYFIISKFTNLNNLEDFYNLKKDFAPILNNNLA